MRKVVYEAEAGVLLMHKTIVSVEFDTTDMGTLNAYDWMQFNDMRDCKQSEVNGDVWYDFCRVQKCLAHVIEAHAECRCFAIEGITIHGSRVKVRAFFHDNEYRLYVVYDGVHVIDTSFEIDSSVAYWCNLDLFGQYTRSRHVVEEMVEVRNV